MNQHNKDAIGAARVIMWTAERFCLCSEGEAFCKIADEAEAIAKRLESAEQAEISRADKIPIPGDQPFPFWSRVICKTIGKEGRLIGYTNTQKNCWVEFENGNRTLIDSDKIELVSKSDESELEPA